MIHLERFETKSCLLSSVNRVLTASSSAYVAATQGVWHCELVLYQALRGQDNREVAANEVVRSLGFTRTVLRRTFNRVCAMSPRHLQKCAHRGAST